jgi:signal transduction histidine kinase
LKSLRLIATTFAALLILLATTLLAARQKAQEVYTNLDEVNTLHRHIERKLRRLRSDIHLSGVFIRDYLLDASHLRGPYYREELTGLRETTIATLEELERSMGTSQAVQMESLRTQLDEYWKTFDPVLNWTPSQKLAMSSAFLQREVIPKREAVLGIASELESLNESSVLQQRAEVARRERDLHAYLNRMLAFSMLLGIGAAALAILRIRILEKRAGEHQVQTERAELEMRTLSQRLVEAQEDERRRLSRELHDEVGQLLTGLRLQFGSAQKAANGATGAFHSEMEQCKDLVDQAIHAVRDLAMGIRPSILDDLGLGAALEWQARDFQRRTQIPVHVTLEGEIELIPEPHRTAIYRVVQEALTNCAKHAQASQISVSLRLANDHLRVLIHDDGVGLRSAEQRKAGLGFVGMKERVRELAGQVSLHSTEGAGTTLQIEIPLPRAEAEVYAAHSDS